MGTRVRMRRRFGVGLLAFFLSMTTSAFASPSLVIARLVHIDDVSYLFPPRPDEIAVDATWKRTFRIRRVLSGTFGRESIQDIHFSAQPVLGYEYFLLIDPSSKEKVVWSLPTSGGFCIHQDVVLAYQTQIDIKAIQQEYPCKDNE